MDKLAHHGMNAILTTLFELHVEDQHTIAEKLAQNCGYKLSDAVREAKAAALADAPLPDGAGEPVAWRLRLPDGSCTARFDGKPPKYHGGPYEVAFASPAVRGDREEGITWRRVNDEPFEYAIQQPGDEFVKLLNGNCLRRPVQLKRRGLIDE